MHKGKLTNRRTVRGEATSSLSMLSTDMAHDNTSAIHCARADQSMPAVNSPKTPPGLEKSQQKRRESVCGSNLVNTRAIRARPSNIKTVAY